MVADGIYFKKDLLKYLKERGLPHSYPTLIRYEKAGVIPELKTSIANFPSKWRVYSASQIIEIADKLEKHLKKE